uniref:Uncharacterized protein n=1 Tax=Glossina brevipalpis TaxID=37001 RepID=A0A1A9WRT5_9MUSC
MFAYFEIVVIVVVVVTGIEEFVGFTATIVVAVNGNLVGGALADSKRLIKAGGNMVGGIGGGGGGVECSAAIKAALLASLTDGKGDLSASSSSSSSLHCDNRRRSFDTTEIYGSGDDIKSHELQLPCSPKSIIQSRLHSSSALLLETRVSNIVHKFILETNISKS